MLGRAWVQDPFIVFLADTQANKDKLKKLYDELQFVEKWVVQRVTRAWGLALLWKNSLDINVDSSSLNHIDVINNKGKDDAWRFTSVYGVLETSRKHET